MSILVKGMEMPKSCYDCVLNHSFFRYLNCANFEGMSGFVGALPHTDDRHPDCPLVSWEDEVKEGKMYARVSQSIGTFVEYSLRIKNAPTIIEAEMEGAEE